MSRKLILLLKMLALSAAMIGVSVLILKQREGKTTSDSQTEYFFAMGTSQSLTLYGVPASMRQGQTERIKAILSDETEKLISWRREDSEIYKLNASYVAGEPYEEISDELYSVIETSLDIAGLSGGACDLTVRPLADLWGIEEKSEEEFSVPPDEDIENVLKLTGYEHVKLKDGALIIDRQGVQLDFGACGKGYALDKVRAFLDTGNVGGAVVSCGGSILVYGSREDGKDFKVGIRDPFKDDGSVRGYLSVPEGSCLFVSTSGDYEKYIEKDGKRYHHILDTKTGRPADSGLSSVTVTADNGLVSDALSTACFVLGEEKSLPLLEKYGCSAVFIDREGKMSFAGNARDMYKDS